MTAEAGTFRVTTAPAPIVAPSPMVTPHKIVAFDPMAARRRTFVGSNCQSLRRCNSPVSVVARGNRSLMNITPWPMKTSSSMVTPAQIKECDEILQRDPILTPAWISTKAPITVPSPIEQP